MGSTRNRMWIAAFFLLGACLTTGMVRGGAGEAGGGSEVQRGFEIAPLPLNLRGKNRDLVGLGSYIVNAQSACNDCHSAQQYADGGNPFMGQPKVIDTDTYLRGGMAFGPFISRNLRPEPDTGLPAGRTYAQFLQIMQHGTDFDLAHPQISRLLQVMPWPTFQDMTERDLRAIYEYLSALPPASPMPPAR
jgi:hypothetical protein